MSETYISNALRRLVEERANNQCEYCLLPANVAFFPHEIDHIVAKKHGGTTEANNLAYSCWRCNRHKGTDLGSIDPETGSFSFLFHPRTQRWNDHFRLEKITLVGLTAEGRTTVRLLQLNSSDRLAERERLSNN
ncbi:MAG: HNH endonuclease signature motif containing protein [Oscillatoria sp. PMC 1068.18]|nr:HNH endonuclease signature motif containing protein [Oscillatoria sp. PMC 1076.18]MEC4984776.1 HNH endonuclease signature motif containing protein [Oscillatoria sp. PMC 1076.18]MEC4987460.1 HNH endonuclease signature motif containing protein [Oscillatoria sp. PMC 1068.18]